jgi:hypothetical protein
MGPPYGIGKGNGLIVKQEWWGEKGYSPPRYFHNYSVLLIRNIQNDVIKWKQGIRPSMALQRDEFGL